MEAIKFLSNSTLVNPLHHHNHRPISRPRNKRPSPRMIIKGAYGGSNNNNGNNGRDHYKSKIVDENMIVLRTRIQETKMLEERSQVPPSDWMEWEKDYYYERYNEDVLEAVGLLQNYFMGIRPGQALGTVAIVALCLVITCGFVIGRAVGIANMMILSGCDHLV